MTTDEDKICAAIGCNVFGRIAYTAQLVRDGEDYRVRAELLALLKFFPPVKKAKAQKVQI